MRAQTFVLRVWGDFACFSRPELKVERFSYPLPPPSAVRGIFDAIYSKPNEFRWQAEKVEVLAEPSYIALRRNEVKDKISVRARSSIAPVSPAVSEPALASSFVSSASSKTKGRRR